MEKESQPIYRNPGARLEDRVQDLLGRMTIEEKIAQMCGCWPAGIVTDDAQALEKSKPPAISHGIGQISRPAICAGPTGQPNGAFRPSQLANALNTAQRYLVEKTRLGIPAIVHEESLSGTTMSQTTMFPQALNYASTWNPELIEKIADVIRKQMRAVGLNQSLSPLLDVCRDPRWGRTEETFGEDTYLVSAIGCAYVRGLQGRDLRDGVIATAKHFLAYGVPEGGHNVGSVSMGPRELRETYAYPFEAAIRECGLASVMHAYHEIDGVPCVASREIMTDLLRGELGFEGVVVSDYGALWMLFDAHKVAETAADAAAMAVHAGLDCEIPEGWAYQPTMLGLVREGRVPVSLIDIAVSRILRLKFMLGLFENPYVEEKSVRDESFDSAPNRKLAHQAAVESLILLKNNDNVLPLSRVKTIGVVGPNADSVAAMLGDYAYGNHTHLKLPIPSTPTLLESIRAAAHDTTKILYAKGCNLAAPHDLNLAEAGAVARESDIIVAVLGEDSFTWSGENKDRTTISLPPAQEDLLKHLRSFGKPVVLVLFAGRPLATFAIEGDCDAILQCWYPGEEGGAAIASVLFGKASPSGRLPISVPRDTGHIPCHYNRRPFSAAGKSRDTGEHIRAHYPFGHGLSYTSFVYENLVLSSDKISGSETLSVSVDITNAGTRDGIETVQLYTRDVVGSVSRPILELKGFHRVALAPQQTSTVTFELPNELLAIIDSHFKLTVEPGKFDIKIGASSADIRCEGSFEFTGAPRYIAQRSVFFSKSRSALSVRKSSGVVEPLPAKETAEDRDHVQIAMRPREVVA